MFDAHCSQRNLVTYLEVRRKYMIILNRQTKCLLSGDRSRATCGKQHRLIAWGNHVTVTLFLKIQCLLLFQAVFENLQIIPKDLWITVKYLNEVLRTDNSFNSGWFRELWVGFLFSPLFLNNKAKSFVKEEKKQHKIKAL